VSRLTARHGLAPSSRRESRSADLHGSSTFGGMGLGLEIIGFQTLVGSSKPAINAFHQLRFHMLASRERGPVAVALEKLPLRWNHRHAP